MLIQSLILVVVLSALVAGQVLKGISIDYDVVITSGNIAKYNLWHSAQKLWEAHLWVASLLIIVWSGIWPYVKLAIAAFLLMRPCASDREDDPAARVRLSRVISVASTLGKWSLLDVWIAAVVSDVTTVKVSLANVSGKLLCGLPIFLASQLLSNGLVAFASTRQGFEFQQGSRHSARSESLLLAMCNRKRVTALVVAAYGCSTALVLAFQFVPCYSVRYGLGETSIETKEFSVAGTLMGLVRSSEPGTEWNQVIGVFGLVAVCATPVVQGVLLLLVMAMPMTRSRSTELLSRLRYLHTICCPDVLLVAVAILRVQIHAARWDLFSQVQNPMLPLSKLEVHMSLLWGFWCLGFVLVLEACCRMWLQWMKTEADPDDAHNELDLPGKDGETVQLLTD